MSESSDTAEMKCSVPRTLRTRTGLTIPQATGAAISGSDAPAVFPGLYKPVPGQLPEIGVFRAGNDQLCGNVALDALELV